MNLSKEIGLRIKSYRIDNNLTQTQLAKMLGIVNSTLSKYEAEGISDIDTINAINETLHINIIEYPLNESLMESPLKDFDLKDFKNSLADLLKKRNPKLEDWSYLEKYEEKVTRIRSFCPYTYPEINELIKLASEIEKSAYPSLKEEKNARNTFNENFTNVMLSCAYNLHLKKKEYYKKIYIPTTYELLNEVENYETNNKDLNDKYFCTLSDSFNELKDKEQISNNPAAFFLLRAVYRYLLENEDIPSRCKNIVDVKKLLNATEIDDKSPITKSPLDLLFDKIEAENKKSFAVEMYKSYKKSDYTAQQQAVLILLFHIEKYIEEKLSKEISQTSTACGHDNIPNYFKKNEICERLGFEKLSNKFKMSYDEFGYMPKYVLRKGEVIINAPLNKMGKVDFNYNI